MFKKSFVMMLFAAIIAVGSAVPVFAEEEYYGNVKADSFYEEESDNAIIFEYPSYIGSEAGKNLSDYFSYCTYASPDAHQTKNFDLAEYRWFYGTVNLVADYGDSGYQIWVSGYDPSYTDTVGWPIESNVAAAKDAEIKEGDTVIVFGKVFSYDSGFNKELYVGGADILITTRSFTDILTEYYNYLENMQ